MYAKVLGVEHATIDDKEFTKCVLSCDGVVGVAWLPGSVEVGEEFTVSFAVDKFMRFRVRFSK